MDNTDEIMWSIFIGTIVARFLLNTSRVLQGIELCRECLILLNNTVQANVDELSCKSIYLVIFMVYCLLNDRTSGIKCNRKLLDFPCSLALGAVKLFEVLVATQLAQSYQFQSKYKEAKRLYKKALGIMIETGDRKEEALCYGNLGTVYFSFGEYAKAEEYLSNALAIRKEIGDEKGEAVCYGNLGTVYHSLGEYGKLS